MNTTRFPKHCCHCGLAVTLRQVSALHFTCDTAPPPAHLRAQDHCTAQTYYCLWPMWLDQDGFKRQRQNEKLSTPCLALPCCQFSTFSYFMLFHFILYMDILPACMSTMQRQCDYPLHTPAPCHPHYGRLHPQTVSQVNPLFLKLPGIFSQQ